MKENQTTFKPEIFTLPEYWACYLINNDASGISSNEKAKADAFLAFHKLPFPVSCSDEPWFGYPDAPLNGPACNLLDYTFLLARA
jgi:hypothetical protein